MGQKMLYRMDYEKAIEAIIWLANKNPGIDIYHVAKILYYAEKTHLNKYGRPIIGASYIRMEYGQVPSEVRDIITKNVWVVEPVYLDRFSTAISIVKEPYDKLSPLRNADLDYFSDTDIECMEEAFIKCVDMTFDQLKDMCHEERTWLETDRNEKIDYLLLIDEENEQKEEVAESIREMSQYVRF